VEQEKNLNWFISRVPEGCHALVVCADEELFDEKVRRGVIPMYDPRKDKEEDRVPVFIGWSGETNLTSLGTLLAPREAR